MIENVIMTARTIERVTEEIIARTEIKNTGAEIMIAIENTTDIGTMIAKGAELLIKFMCD